MTATNLAGLVQAFLVEHLPMHRNLSPNTIKSYRDTISLLLKYCRDYRKLAPERLKLEHLKEALVIDFLTYIETERDCSIQTRNQRLAAIHAFFKFVQAEMPEHILSCQQILEIPFKRHERFVLKHLKVQERKAILSQPNAATHFGRRDLVILSLLYDTGARVQEIIDLRVRDVRLEAPTQVHLMGKGRKARVVPLLPSTTALLAGYFHEKGFDSIRQPDQCLFANRQGRQFTRAGVTYLVHKYVEQARRTNISFPARVSPHTFRHTKAMHMLHAGVPLIIIRDFLGHVDLKTTEVYARVDLEMKRQALEKTACQVAPPQYQSWCDDANLLEWNPFPD
jgi:site-specific recombinase XerD